ncbi:Arabinanase [Venustampulla echinocandica]|uniref:Arabinanase n=1 Tax=Venustampulla echinocandica TaxID=2656787 RepID=A0A370TYF8_9HELO|nr:Arabinanase [Venustampulla echinocandica]RDL40559.1 Arabinanase [Venustampulla echinocandica]
MWSFNIVPKLLIVTSIFKGAFIAAGASVSATFNNNIQYKFDTDGNSIDSTSGKIDFFDGAYIWYGLANGCGRVFCGILSWSSTDLQTWHPNGFLFDPNTPQIQDFCAPPLSGNCGRPHIVYSKSTKTYVLWLDEGSPGFALFTSSRPTSGYTLSANRALVGYQPPGPFKAGDFSVAVINGTGYIAYSLLDFSTVGASIWPPFVQSIYVQQLTPSLLNTTGNVTHVVSAASDLVDLSAESPDIFRRGDYFYITASNTCGFCTGTLLVVYRSKTIIGPWIRQIISADTCGGQTTGVLTLPGPSGRGDASYLHQADLFSTAPLTGIRTAAHAHQFQLLTFSDLDGSVNDLNCTLSHSATASVIKGTLPKSGKPSHEPTVSSPDPLETPYTPSCLLPTYQLYQTFISPKTGKLSTVSVNIAGIANSTGTLQLTIFRYDNTTAFYTPFYKWDTLATASIPGSSISQAFEAISVPVNSNIKANDKLGIAVVWEGVAPLCVMVTGATGTGGDGRCPIEKGPGGSGRDGSLFAIGAAQVSFRGKVGKTPPIVVLDGEIKWAAVIN